MIAQKYRLTEREVKKVLNHKKPFFSNIWIANILKNVHSHGRCGILLSSKCTKGSVNRNFWRRKFYDISSQYLAIPLDIVVVVKKGNILNYKNPLQIETFETDMQSLFKKIKLSQK